MAHRSGLTAIADALICVQTLSSKHSEQAKMIDLGATAWAYGITPEMMDVFGKLASSKRVTAEDMRQLERHGIENRAVPKRRVVMQLPEASVETSPFKEALNCYVEKLHQPALMPKPEGGALKVCARCAKQMHAVEEGAVWPCDMIKAVRGENQ